jgi:hypothetical protein
MRVEIQPSSREDAWVDIFVCPVEETSEEAGELSSPSGPLEVPGRCTDCAKKEVSGQDTDGKCEELPQ